MIRSLRWRIKEKYLLKQCKGKQFPISIKPDEWAVVTKYGLEWGSAFWVASEFCGDSLIYNYKIDNFIGHTHGFEGVIETLMLNPMSFSIKGFEEEYSAQELRMLHKLQKKLEDCYETK